MYILSCRIYYHTRIHTSSWYICSRYSQKLSYIILCMYLLQQYQKDLSTDNVLNIIRLILTKMSHPIDLKYIKELILHIGGDLPVFSIFNYVHYVYLVPTSKSLYIHNVFIVCKLIKRML